MLSIKNNIMSANAARHLSASYNSLSRSVERLSSGLRINSAKDDAAGMAVSELIRADIATFRQGQRNANDGISMLQTAEGALSAVDDILIRMKELAEQASTDGYSNAQRTLMNNEFTELGKEISRIAETTDYNGIQLLYSTSQYEIHVGSTDASTSNEISLTAENMDAGTLELTASKEVATFTTNVATLDSTLITATATGDIEFQMVGDTNDDDVAIGKITLGVVDTTEYTLQQVIDAINLASQTAQTGYDMAAAHYDSGSGLFTIKLTAYKAGNHTNLAITGDGTTSATNFENAAKWSTTDGTDTGQDISTKAGAQSALTKVDEAISTKDTYRAKLGYMMNRLEAAAQVVGIQAENLSAAESRIRDVDVASEMATMTRNQVLAQAGISMLAQANSMPQMALKLLG
ncbi:MAG: flagellin [Planctomycetes bacterium]|nr:flagellin [Planctomycetota bacterium]